MGGGIALTQGMVLHGLLWMLIIFAFGLCLCLIIFAVIQFSLRTVQFLRNKGQTSDE